MIVVRLTGLAPVPWKNGCGSTVEIARSPKGTGPFAWRLSRATLAVEAPFSSFPGIERSLVLAAGKRLHLDFDHGKSATLGRIGALIRFPGHVGVIGRPGPGPVAALNLMVDPKRASLHDDVADVSGVARFRASLLHVLDGRVAVGEVLAPGDSVVIERPTTFRVVAESRALLYVAEIQSI